MPKLRIPEKEQWRFYPANPLYAISSYGRVFSFKRNRFIKGYIQKDERGKPVKVRFTLGEIKRDGHYLVADLWMPPKPSPEHTIDHINRNPLNNFHKNLRWATLKVQTDNRANRLVKSVKFNGDDLERMYQRTKTEFLATIAVDYKISKIQLLTILKLMHPHY